VICEHHAHKWEVEEIGGKLKYNGYVKIKLRCLVCNCSLEGEVIT